MEAIQHGVPMVGIPVLSDQHDNVVRIEVKNLGVSLQLKQLKAEMLALKMKKVIEDKRYVALRTWGHTRCMKTINTKGTVWILFAI